MIFMCRTIGSRLSFDCGMRELALDFASFIQPDLTSTQLNQIADALNGSPEKAPNCQVSPKQIPKKLVNDKNVQYDHDSTYPEYLEYPWTVFVHPEAVASIDNNSKHKIGTIDNPYNTIQAAIDHTRYYRKQFQLTSNNNNNQNDNGNNNVFTILLRQGTYYILKPVLLNNIDNGLIIKNYDNEKAIISGAVLLSANNTKCEWNYVKSINNHNIYSIDLSNSVLNNDILQNKIFGLRINNTRGIRARYPNGNPEIDGFGSTLIPVSYIGPNLNDTKTSKAETEIYITDPSNLVRNTTSTGDFWYYQLGIGGVCNQFLPNAGYWCGDKTQGGGAFTYRIPKGFFYNSSILPNAPYKNVTNAVVSVWHPSHWANWFFTLSNQLSNNTAMVFEQGGYQGARGQNKGIIVVNNYIVQL